jgi:hypothetical protein
MIDLDSIRARDRDYDDVFEAQANMSKDIAHRLVAWPVADRRDLLAYVDELRKDAERMRWGIKNARWLRHEHEAYVAIPVAVSANLDCVALRIAAIDAAMEQSHE